MIDIIKKMTVASYCGIVAGSIGFLIFWSWFKGLGFNTIVTPPMYFLPSIAFSFLGFALFLKTARKEKSAIRWIGATTMFFATLAIIQKIASWDIIEITKQLSVGMFLQFFLAGFFLMWEKVGRFWVGVLSTGFGIYGLLCFSLKTLPYSWLWVDPTSAICFLALGIGMTHFRRISLPHRDKRQ